MCVLIVYIFIIFTHSFMEVILDVHIYSDDDQKYNKKKEAAA